MFGPFNSKEYKQTFDSQAFSSGKHDDWFQNSLRFLNIGFQQASKYQPYNSKPLPWSTYLKVATTDPDVGNCIALWTANFDANGSSVKAGKNIRLEKQIYDLIYYDLDYSSLWSQIIFLIASQGNAIVMFNDQDIPVVYSAENFNIYWDEINKRTVRYALKINGAESNNPKLKHLQHGKDLWHFKDPLFNYFPLAFSRIDLLYSWLLLDNHALQANNNFFSQGAIGTVLLGLGEKAAELKAQKDDKGKNKLDLLLEKIRDTITGTQKAHRVASIPYLEKLFELGKSNRDMQFLELMNMSTEKKAKSFSVTMADLGKDVTYNNASVFDYALYDKIGRHLEHISDKFRNDFLLPHYGIITSDRVYIEHNRPKDPDDRDERRFWFELWKAKAITNEIFATKQGLLPEDIPEPDPAVQDPNQPPNNSPNNFFEFFESGVRQFSAPNPLNTILNSKQYTKTENIWSEAILNQLGLKSTENSTEVVHGGFLDQIQGLSEDQLQDFKIKLDPITNFYPKSEIVSDILKFVGFTSKITQKDIKSKQKKKYDESFDGEYPESIAKYIDKRVEELILGKAEFKGIDAETAGEIEQIINDNKTLGVAKLADLLAKQIPELSKKRASLINQTEVSNAVEHTRETMYTEANFKTKEWLSVGDSKVRPAHRENQAQGRIPIDDLFSSGESRSGSVPRCRCTTLYYP